MSDEDDDSLYESAPEDEGQASAAGSGEPKDTQRSGNSQNNGSPNRQEESAFKLRIRRVGSNEDLEITTDNGMDTTVRQLKEMLRERTGIEEGTQQLIFGGRIMNDQHALREYSHLGNGSTIHLLVRPQRSQQNDGNNREQTQNGQAQQQGNPMGPQITGDGQAMTMVLDTDAPIPQIIGRIQTALQQALQPQTQQPSTQPATGNTGGTDVSHAEGTTNSTPHVQVAFGSGDTNGGVNATASTSNTTPNQRSTPATNNSQRSNGINTIDRVENAAHSLRQLMNHSIPHLETHAGGNAPPEHRVSSVLRSLHRVVHAAELPLLTAADAIHSIRGNNDQALRQRLQQVVDSLSEQLQLLGMLMIQGGESLRCVHIARNHSRDPTQGQEMYTRLQQYVRGSNSENPFQQLLHQRHHTGHTQAPNETPASQQSASISVGPFRLPLGDIASRIRAANSQQQPGQRSSIGSRPTSSGANNTSANPSDDDLD